MSIASSIQDEEIKQTLSGKVNVAIKKVFSGKDPLADIFYFSLACCMIGLAVGWSFPLPFYIILGIISIVQVYRYFYKQSIITNKDK